MPIKLFISGSRSIHAPTLKLMEIVKHYSEKPIEVLIGDADGIDTLVQLLLKQFNFTNVTVYHIGTKPRFIASKAFKTKQITGSHYSDKDIAMCQDCDCAIAFWDGISKGTEANIKNCLKLYKPAKIYKKDGNNGH